MIGKYFDKLALCAFTACAFYLLYVNAYSSVPAAITLALVSCVLLWLFISGFKRRVSCGKRAKAKQIRRAASEMPRKWSGMDEEAAKAQIFELIQAAYKGESLDISEFALITRHPSGASVGIDEIFDIWKRERGRERLIIAATAEVEPRAVAFSEELEAPLTRVLTPKQLCSLYTKSAPRAEEARKRRGSKLKPAIKSILCRVTDRRRARKNALFGAMLTALYIISGSIFYLPAGLALLLFAALSLKKPSEPDALFE